MRSMFVISMLVAVAGSALAQPTLDGVFNVADGWGAAVASQDTNTQFANATGPNTGNELNQMFVRTDTNNLYVGLSGNIQDNNGIVIFMDTAAGGSNVLNTNPGLPTCPNTVPTLIRVHSGGTLETGFGPDWSFLISVGIFPGQSTSQLVMACDLTNLNTRANVPLGIGFVNGGSELSASASTGVVVGSNNSNAAGVGDYGVSPTPVLPGEDPATCTTGFEIKIPKSLIGLAAAGSGRFFAYLSNNANDGSGCFRSAFGSNQALPGVGGLANLGPFSGDNFGPFLDLVAVPGSQVTAAIPLP